MKKEGNDTLSLSSFCSVLMMFHAFVLVQFIKRLTNMNINFKWWCKHIFSIAKHITCHSAYIFVSNVRVGCDQTKRKHFTNCRPKKCCPKQWCGCDQCSVNKISRAKEGVRCCWTGIRGNQMERKRNINNRNCHMKMTY